MAEAGGPDRSTQVVKFPPRESDSTVIRIEGTDSVVTKIAEAIEAFVSQQEDQTSDMVDVPTEKHRFLIGRGGDTRRRLQEQFHVSLDIPKNGSGQTYVKITGSAEDVSKAKEHIARITKGQEGDSIPIPISLHHKVAQEGRFFRDLRRDYGVTVGHGGRKPPAKDEAAAPRAKVNGPVPLITDDASVEDFSWDLQEGPALSSDAPTIPWIISGPSEAQVAAAKALVERAVEAASAPSTTGYLILPDPRSKRLVIGAGGRNINTIRAQTGCDIQVPRRGQEGEAITIIGSRTGCEEAKAMILEAVENGESSMRH